MDKNKFDIRAYWNKLEVDYKTFLEPIVRHNMDKSKEEIIEIIRGFTSNGFVSNTYYTDLIDDVREEIKNG